MRIEIKLAAVQDAETISNIYASSWKASYQGIIPKRYLDELQKDFWISHFQNWISNNILKAKIIYQNSIAIGCIAYGKSRDETLPKWGEIVSLYVHPDYCRKGYGQKLLDAALVDMRKNSYQNCYLWVLKENKNAQHFYEKNGFRRNQDEYHFEIMAKQLTDIRYVINLNNDFEIV